MATTEDCAVASDGAHWLFFSTLREGFAGIVSPEGRWLEGELMRGIFHPVTTGGWLTPIYCS